MESFVILNAVGGECLEDFRRLREDAGWSEMIEPGIPSPEASRQIWYPFHDEEKRGEARPGRSGQEIAHIPEESEALKEAIEKLPEEAWGPHGRPHGVEMRECAEGSFVPGEKSEPKDNQPLR